MILLSRVVLGLWLILIGSMISYATDLEFHGQASGWGIVDFDSDITGGFRYIPDLTIRYELSDKEYLDSEIAVNAYITKSDTEIKPYRLWVRYGTSQLEARAGLQKINFGSAKLLRSLIWFDQLDPRDPLQLTDGVYGLLVHYYFLNNANVWCWGLYGNDDMKGLEMYATDKDRLEFGGRYQVPVPRGEIAISFDHRSIDKTKWNAFNYISMTKGSETRGALDGSWDLGIGFWFETVLSEVEITENVFIRERYLTMGTDYTFDIGRGLHLLGEHMIKRTGSDIAGYDSWNNISAIAVDYPLNILDSIKTIGYQDWDTHKFYPYFSFQRKYDNWMITLSLFSVPESKDNILFSGKGILCLVSFNH